MAVDEDTVSHTYSDSASVSLLRRLRAGAAIHFVHQLDVCSAAPAALVNKLEPAPGTDGTWYFYCSKKFKNAQGKASGHRQRAISGGDTCWHAEARPKGVDGSEAGGTACNLSYGRKDGRSFTRLGWCMMEYDDHSDATGGGEGYVLCKVYQSSRAQAKKAPPSSGKSAAATSKATKRKAAGGEHPEARPAKLNHEQDSSFTNNYDVAVPSMEMYRVEEEHQQLSTEPTQDDGEFFETPFGPLRSDVALFNAEEWIGGMEEELDGEEGHALLEQQTGVQDDGFLAEPTGEDLFGQDQETTTSGMTPAADPPPDADFFDFDGFEPLFGVQEEQSVQVQQPRAEPAAGPLAEFVQSQWMTCQQQESEWMTMWRLLQGPPSFLTCS
ncbi:unnamed protein product [Urochloa humidicola]